MDYAYFLSVGIVGATVGVGLCTGDIRAINWRMVSWIYMGWFITLPVTGIIAGCLMGKSAWFESSYDIGSLSLSRYNYQCASMGERAVN